MEFQLGLITVHTCLFTLQRVYSYLMICSVSSSVIDGLQILLMRTCTCITPQYTTFIIAAKWLVPNVLKSSSNYKPGHLVVIVSAVEDAKTTYPRTSLSRCTILNKTAILLNLPICRIATRSWKFRLTLRAPREGRLPLRWAILLLLWTQTSLATLVQWFDRD